MGATEEVLTTGVSAYTEKREESAVLARSEATSGRLLVMWVGDICEERSDELKECCSVVALPFGATVASLQPSLQPSSYLSSAYS